MMQQTTIVSFLMLFCDLCGTLASNNDLNATTSSDIKTLINEDLLNSCIFGVQSVRIVLFTSNIRQGQVVEVNKSCDLFNTSKRILFITHGFISNAYNFPVFVTLLIKKYTIFSLDWSNASCYNDPAIIKLLAYPFAVQNTLIVGDYLASYAKSVIDTCHVPLKNIVFIGHSLGAHVSSFAAKNFQKSRYGKIPLLIGTDPAAPLFTHQNCENKFCETDAERVIAFHTSILGIQTSIGHLDLWFNNGIRQPTCGLFGFDLECAHSRALDYLAHTLLDNCVYMGIPTSSYSLFTRLTFSCSSNKTDAVIVDRNIFDNNCLLEGDYCIEVTSYPYCRSLSCE